VRVFIKVLFGIGADQLLEQDTGGAVCDSRVLAYIFSIQAYLVATETAQAPVPFRAHTLGY